MKWRVHVFAAAAGVAVTISSAAAAQTVAASFERLQHSIGEAASSNPSQEHLLIRIAEDTVALQVAAPTIKDEDRAEFARSMDYNAQLLEQAAIASEQDSAAILADVADDLEVKRMAGSGMGVASAFPGRVKVHVVTIRNGQSAPGYVITLNPVRWGDKEPMYRLSSLTPAAAGEVPPGRYEVSAILQNSIQARAVFRVGLAAEDEMRLELPVP